LQSKKETVNGRMYTLVCTLVVICVLALIAGVAFSKNQSQHFEMEPAPDSEIRGLSECEASWISDAERKKLKTGNLEQLNNRVDVICAGTKGMPISIRCVKTKDGYVYPPYGKEPPYAISNDGTYILINGEIKVSTSVVRDTAYQCWPVLPNSSSVTEEEFKELLKTYQFSL
jgi:hypothetical protein